MSICPAHNLSSSTERVKHLEAFWDSGVARFGEQGARGWARWLETGGEGRGAGGLISGESRRAVAGLPVYLPLIHDLVEELCYLSAVFVGRK